MMMSFKNSTAILLVDCLLISCVLQLARAAVSKSDNILVPTEEDDFLYDLFPLGFKWGFATAAYQVEGGWNADGKGPNIWDNWTHSDTSPIFDGSSGDVACDSYHKYKEDVQLLKNAGAKHYRFSISWARVLPDSSIEGGVNGPGMEYYSALIDELLENGIEPMVTLYHWDLPQALQDLGGFVNETIFVDRFAAYARLMFGNFGDRVKLWLTFNEPWVICYQGYGNGASAPGIVDPATGPYRCAHSLLKAHAQAYRIYESEFKTVQKGRVGITLDSNYYTPDKPGVPEYEEATERARIFKHGWLASPIFHGKYPDLMREIVDRKSAQEGRDESRLPSFDEEWSRKLKGSYDFLGLNHYTTEIVIPQTSGGQGWFEDQDIITYQDPDWPSSGTSWLKVVPWGFRKLLNWIKDTYDNPEVLVTENGFSDNEKDGIGLEDSGRENFYRLYINEMLKAIKLDGCNVTSYMAWSLMDNFEWLMGYSERFGAHWVNFTDPGRPRQAKNSVKMLKKIFTDNGFVKEE